MAETVIKVKPVRLDIKELEAIFYEGKKALPKTIIKNYFYDPTRRIIA